MHIDFTLQIDEKKIDLSINSKQCIGEVAKDILRIRKDVLPDYYLSCMQREYKKWGQISSDKEMT